MKYAPRKVYIKESGGYAELSYTDFCRRKLSDSERVLVNAIFFEELSEREVGLRLGREDRKYSNRRFYRWANDFGEYLEGMADR